MNSLSKFYFEHLNICGLILTDGGVTAADTGSQPSLSPLRCKHSSDLFDNICVGEAEEEGHRHPLGRGGQRGHYLSRKIIRRNHFNEKRDSLWLVQAISANLVPFSWG